jgi:hypothetical protein
MMRIFSCTEKNPTASAGFEPANSGTRSNGKTFIYSVCDIRNRSIIIISHNDSVIATLDSCQHSKPQQRMTSEDLRVKPILSRSESSEVLAFIGS